MKLIIAPRASKKPSSRFPLTLNLASSATLAELKLAIQSASKLNIHRQRLTTSEKKVLEGEKLTLDALGLKEGDTVEIKDLGPQISWQTVFLVEYLGPILIHPVFYFGSKFIYGQEFEHSLMQTVALSLVVLHYIKREIETLFVHRFSAATMPRFNLVKNSSHYWILSGFLLATPLYGPWNGAARIAGSIRADETYIYTAIGVWIFAEISNAIVHLHLRSLRPAGSTTRAIPTGYGFGLVSCPNYFFEAIAWSAFLALTLDWAAALFLAVSAGQMLVWAQKKHSRYRKDFGKAYPRGRKAMIPFLY